VSSAFPNLGLNAAFEFLIEAFGDHPDRYELFAAAANFAMRQGRSDLAERLFFNCLAEATDAECPVDEVRQSYDQAAQAYDGEANHLATARQFLAATIPHLEGRQDLTLVDAACGTGALAAGLRRHSSNLIGLHHGQRAGVPHQQAGHMTNCSSERMRAPGP
jgi:hypothetical protein